MSIFNLFKKKGDGASPDYLADITGTSPDLGLGEFIKKTGHIKVLPGYVQDLYAEGQKEQADNVHSYLCNLEKEAESGKKNSCGSAKAFNKYGRDLLNGRDYLIQFEVVDRMPYRYTPSKNGVTIAKPAKRPDGLGGVDGRFDRKRPHQSRQKYHVGKVDTTIPKNTEVEKFEAAVNGEEGSTMGQRALYYGADGQVLRGTAAITRETKNTQLSAATATYNQTGGNSAGATPTTAPTLKAGNHPNKKKAGETTDSGGSAAGLGTIAMISLAMAALLPMHFVTSAITFINSVVTFFTTTKSAIATYTAIVDAVLGLFGMRGATKDFKDLLNGFLDNAFGKENIAYAKAIFAGTLNSVSIGVKLAEKIQQLRAGTDSKIDELAVGLGLVNNGLKDAGLLPPDSPYLASSKAIDDLVTARSTGEGADEEQKDNIYKMTEEIKTKEETTKELEKEQEIRDKAQAKKQKATDDAKRLTDTVKTNVETVKKGDL